MTSKTITPLTPTEALKLIAEKSPHYEDGNGADTPMPVCFWCGACNWDMQHRDNCVWLRAQESKR